MNSNQPLELLTKTSGENSVSSMQSTANQNERQNQLALASFFSSLSSLANRQQQQQQQPQQQQQIPFQMQIPQNLVNSCSQQKTISPMIQDQDIKNSQTTGLSSPMALTNSIQSAVAAAMMQQQLVSQVQSGPNYLCDQLNLINQQESLHLSASINQQQQTQHHHQQQQQQRINYCTICNKELCNKYFMKTHMLKMHGINLEMEQPNDEVRASQSSDDNQNEQKFENSEGEGEQNDGSTSDTNQEVKVSDANESGLGASSAGNNQKRPLGKIANINKKLNSTGAKQTTSVMNGFAGNSMGGVVCDICNKELCSKYFLKVHKQNTHGIMTDYQDAANQFVYPFGAPNPFMPNPQSLMAGPTNSALPGHQLAFLNTPQTFGVCPSGSNLMNETTFDACQIDTANTFENIPKKANGPKRQRLEQNQRQNSNQNANINIEKQTEALLDLASDPTKDMNSVYRLILAQQQKAQQQATSQTRMLMMPTGQPLVPSLDPIAANQVNALMCFGALAPTGPFGSPAAAMSPAIIVENILRNQHLFNRAKCTTSPSGQPKSNTDPNNNNSGKIRAKKSNSGSKDPANNSRYFSHYTEACPMCDRRFKSIKWLKTHMMNDHKQEIGAYMQMMMQYIYTSKSQQMAATIAAMEQQQNLLQQSNEVGAQLPTFLHQSQQQHHQQHTNLFDKCLNLVSTCRQQTDPQGPVKLTKTNQPTQVSSHILQHQRVTPRISPPFKRHLQINRQQQECEIQDLAIDARCKTDSSSSDDCYLLRGSPSSPEVKSQYAFSSDKRIELGLDFAELSRSSDQKSPEAFMPIRESPIMKVNFDIDEDTDSCDTARVKEEIAPDTDCSRSKQPQQQHTPQIKSLAN